MRSLSHLCLFYYNKRKVQSSFQDTDSFYLLLAPSKRKYKRREQKEFTAKIEIWFPSISGVDLSELFLAECVQLSDAGIEGSRLL